MTRTNFVRAAAHEQIARMERSDIRGIGIEPRISLRLIRATNARPTLGDMPHFQALPARKMTWQRAPGRLTLTP
jgi:hypothetical protein